MSRVTSGGGDEQGRSSPIRQRLDFSSPSLNNGSVRQRRRDNGSTEEENPSSYFHIEDHWTLRHPIVRHVESQGKADKYVLDGLQHQLIFELNNPVRSADGTRFEPPRILVRRARVYGFGVVCIKLLYVYVATVLFGFWCSFCIVLILQYALGVFLQGVSGKEPVFAMGTLLGMPILLSILAGLVTVAAGVVHDIWNDFEFLNSITVIPKFVRNWLAITLIVLAPMATFAISMFQYKHGGEWGYSIPDPYTATTLAMFWCSMILYLIYLVIIFALEIHSSLILTKRGFWYGTLHLIICRYRRKLCLTRWEKFPDLVTNYRMLARAHELGEDSPNNTLEFVQPFRDRCIPCLSMLYTPTYRRVWEIKDFEDHSAYFTKSGLAMHYLLCIPQRKLRGILSLWDVFHSSLCMVVSFLLIWAAVTSFVHFLGQNFVVTVLVAVLLAILLSYIAQVNLSPLLRAARRTTTATSSDTEQALPRHQSSNVMFSPTRDLEYPLLQEVAGETGDVGESNDNTGGVSSRATSRIEEEKSNAGDGVSVLDTELDLGLIPITNESIKVAVADPGLFIMSIFALGELSFLVLIPTYSFMSLGLWGYGYLSLFLAFLSMMQKVYSLNYLTSIERRVKLPDVSRSDDEAGHELPMHLQEADEDMYHSLLFDGQRRRFSSVNESSATSGRYGSENTYGQEDGRPKARAPSEKERQVLVQKMRRMHLLLTRMKKRGSVLFYATILGISVAASVGLSIAAIGTDPSKSKYAGVEIVGAAGINNTYEVKTPPWQERGVLYPSCRFSDLSGLVPGANDTLSMNIVDFGYLAETAYVSTEFTQHHLDLWFGKDQVVDVTRLFTGRLGVTLTEESKTFYRVFHVVGEQGYIVSIRGTHNFYDILADAALWLPSMMMQLLQLAMPFGYLWNNLIPHLVQYMNLVSVRPGNVAYDHDIGLVVKEIRALYPDSPVMITGHSLGGGLAIITGARQHVPAISFSGPNAKLSHLKFGIERDALDKYTINVAPMGDLVTLFDEPALVTQNIRCRAPPNSAMLHCHSIALTLCELIHVCGSGNRPPIKNCADEFGYPKPTQRDPDL